MNRPAIVIRDIHHYGDDLTVPEAAARLRDGGQVTVTVTPPRPEATRAATRATASTSPSGPPSAASRNCRRRSPGKHAPSKPPAAPPCSPRP